MPSITDQTRYLRRNQTDAEKILWERLRNRHFHGLKFLRQHPFKIEVNNRTIYFIADFYCAEKKLVIEVDGSIHEKKKQYDEYRSYILSELGINIIRFNNKQILGDIENVLKELEGIVE